MHVAISGCNMQWLQKVPAIVESIKTSSIFFKTCVAMPLREKLQAGLLVVRTCLYIVVSIASTCLRTCFLSCTVMTWSLHCWNDHKCCFSTRNVCSL